MLLIGPYAFQCCFNLADISMAEDAPSTGEGLFSDCIDPSDICEDALGIGEFAFFCCDSLTSIHIPEGVTKIGESAFVGCNSLTAISIPESVSVIETAAFCDCEGLVRIDYCGTPSQWKSIKKGYAWNFRTGAYTIYFSDGSKSKKKSSKKF